MEKPSVNEQLSMLGKLTELTGGLHEVQVRQLQMYALACSIAVVSATFTPDPDKKVIAYELEMDYPNVEKDIGKRFVMLKKAVTIIMRGWSATIRIRQKGTKIIDPEEVLS